VVLQEEVDHQVVLQEEVDDQIEHLILEEKILVDIVIY
jgi:hypothetical protein